MMRPFKHVLLAATLVLGAASPGLAAASYKLTNLGRGVATGINSAGVVVGGLGTPDNLRAFRLDGGTVEYLSDAFSLAQGINDSGDIWGSTGRLLDQSGFIRPAGNTFLVNTGSFFIEDVERRSASVTAPAGVTDARVGAFEGRAAFDLLGCCGTFSNANGTTSSGRARAVNSAWTATGQLDGQAFVAELGTRPGAPYGAVQLLGTLGGATSSGNDINDRGIIVGNSRTTGGFDRAFVYAGGSMQELDALDGVDLTDPSSFAYAINNAGLIVGSSQIYAKDELFVSTRATLWRDGGVFDLNDFIDPAEGFVLTNAFAINDAGQIVGDGFLRGDLLQRRYAFVLDMKQSNAVPEPASWALMVGGFGMIGGVVRRRARVNVAFA